jgi:hypothetical protein
VNTADPLGLGTIWAKVNALAMKWILLIDVTFSNGVPMSGVSRHIEGRRRSDHSSLEIFLSVFPVLTAFCPSSRTVLYITIVTITLRLADKLGLLVAVPSTVGLPESGVGHFGGS